MGLQGGYTTAVAVGVLCQLDASGTGTRWVHWALLPLDGRGPRWVWWTRALHSSDGGPRLGVGCHAHLMGGGGGVVSTLGITPVR